MSAQTRNLSALAWGLGALAIAAVLMAPGMTGAQEAGAVVVIDPATGLGSVYPGDAARSREEALEAAFRDAVEQASGIFVTAETEVRNFELVRDDVLTRSQGFVRQYEVISEGVRGNIYRILIRATIEKAAFIKDMNASLELLYQRVGKPRVLVVIVESNDPLGDNPGAPPKTSFSVTEKEIRKILLKQGFQFVDARAIGGASVIEAAVTGGTIIRDRVVDLARTAEAEIVVMGRASTRSKGKIGRFHSVQASLSLDVVRAANGRIMASESILSTPAVDLDPIAAGLLALKKAANEITPPMMEQITYLWVRERNQGAVIEIVVEGVSFGELIAFRKALGNSVRGVKQVNQRSYSEGVALLEVVSRSKIDALAEAIYETDFKDFQVEIRNLAGNRLTVKVVSP